MKTADKNRSIVFRRWSDRIHYLIGLALLGWIFITLYRSGWSLTGWLFSLYSTLLPFGCVMALAFSVAFMAIGWRYKKPQEMYQEQGVEYCHDEEQLALAALWLERSAYHSLEEAYVWMRLAVILALVAGFLFWLYTRNADVI